MTDKVQLIKQEIESIEQILDDFNKTHNDPIDNGIVSTKKNICKQIKSFIDSLQEEPANGDLEEEISNYIKDNFFGSGSIGFLSNRTKGELDSIDVANIARHFAEWQRKKDQETIELAEDHAMLAGMNKMKEEMMKALIGGEVVKDIYNQLSVESEPLNNAFGDIKFGDKVKIIIVKTEQQ